MTKDTLHLLFFLKRSFTGSSGCLVFENYFQKREKPNGNVSKKKPLMAFSAQPVFYRALPGVSGRVRCPV
ncbi:MAG: hypothetical protein COX19_06000 [Desulfobacterales bacterium CG23_combo_of_CG06-09_8_20_14_all_51_8]|nr:MAG: hypothetical protein COX19_06000 [Desulfobacterales bacterium CG23_combo_of_CG06-09_8_20_14_all_51_8]